jgi:hypothetical protein
VAYALRTEQDGARIRRELTTALRKTVEPAVIDAKSRIMAMGSGGLDHAGEPLRSTIASRVRAEARTSGKASGVRVRARTTPGARGFKNAPRRTNRASGWRHPVFGNTEVWVHQEGAVGWFDNAMHAHPDEYAAAARKVIQDAAERIRNGA